MDQRLDIKVMVSLGSGQGYTIGQRAKVDAPWEGDTMMSRTGQLIGSRVGGEHGALGYAVDKITFSPGAARSTWTAP